MEINKVTNLLGSKRYKLGKNLDTNLQLHLEQTTKPLTEYDILDIVNLQELSVDEREACTKYRFNGKLNIYASADLAPNSTTYINGKYTSTIWDPLFYGNPAVAPNNWVMQITYPSNSDYNYLINSRTNSGLITSNAFRGLQYEKLGYFLTNNDNYLTISGVQNHNLSVGDTIYLYSNSSYNSLQGIHTVRFLGINGDNEKKDLTLDTIVNPNNIPFSFGNFIRVVDPSSDDINFNDALNFSTATATDISGNTTGSYSLNETIYTTITTTLPNNLITGDFIEIKDYPNWYLNGIWEIYNILNTTKFVIKATVSNIKGTNVNPTPSPLYRRLDGTPSEYYIRKFEVLTSNNYEVYPASYSTTIYPDVSDLNLGVINDTYMFQFNKDVNVERLIENRGGPISELYYAITKRAGKYPFDWSNVTADWDFNYKDATVFNGLENISLNSTAGIGTIEKFSARTETVDINGDFHITEGSKYIGDFIEYNRLELKEITVADVIHRFGLSSDLNGESYYYKPFKRLQLRVYSNFIETAEPSENIVDIPNNFVTYPDFSVAWRDLLTVGYFEEGTNGVDYPFLNASHYFYFNHNFYVRRQNPQSPISFENRAKDLKNSTPEC